MAFAIMRAKKLSFVGSVASSLKHCYRDRDTPNADKLRTHSNLHMAAKSTNEAMSKLRTLLPEKRRKDAVLAIEYVITASPGWWKTASKEKQMDFFNKSYKWLADKYGVSNIITATIHTDETSPHLSAFVVPITRDGRLSAKEFIGNRSKMAADQTSFAEAVKHLGLERGIERSRATHTSIKQYYSAINKAVENQVIINPQVLEPRAYKKQGIIEKLGLSTRVETNEAIAARLTKSVNNSFANVIANAAVSAQNARRTHEMQKTMLDQQKKLEALREPFKGLSREQTREVLDFAARKQRENEIKRAEELRRLQQEIERQQQQQQQQRSSRKSRARDDDGLEL